MLNILVSTALTTSLLLTPVGGSTTLTAGQAACLVDKTKLVLSTGTMDLSYRYPIENTSRVFAENILVNLYHLSRLGKGESEQITEGFKPQENVPASFSLTLQPGEVFAFHDQVLNQYKESKIVAPEGGYRPKDGYILLGGLYGNGVCHLATLMNYVARRSGVEVTALTRHDFAPVPGFDREYGTSISTGNSPERQNLYIKNDKEMPLELKFDLQGNELVFTMSLVAL